jgi:hypothetical protein
MRRILHLITSDRDSLADSIIRDQLLAAGNEIVVLDLTVPSPDYPHAVEEIFKADSIETW